jgi:hypothetical protein
VKVDDLVCSFNWIFILDLFHEDGRTESRLPPDHLSFDSAPNLGISRWEI